MQANESATSESNDLKQPTEKQKEAGNYKKGRVQFAGLDITIENPKGSTRSGTSQDGKEWAINLKHHYGDIKGTKGADGDPLDVFLGDNLEPDSVFIVDQIDPKTREFDEHKIMLGFSSKQEARNAYLANYDENWMGLGKLNVMTLDKFKAWLKGNTTQAISYKNGSFSDYAPDDNSDKREDGFSLENISEVMDYWLKENPQD